LESAAACASKAETSVLAAGLRLLRLEFDIAVDNGLAKNAHDQ
jgi:hypothetical protein